MLLEISGEITPKRTEGAVQFALLFSAFPANQQLEPET